MANPAGPYTDPETGCARNQLNISNPADLQLAEYEYSAWRATQLAERPLPGDFDLPHLQAIHQYLFQDIYDWAGHLKTVENSVRAPFAKPEHIVGFAAEVFGRLHQADCYRNLPRDDYVRCAAELFADINAMHPFWEGNGRANCHFHTQLAARAGWQLDWTRIDRETLDAASARGMNNSDALQAVFTTALIAERSNPGAPLAPALVRRQQRESYD